MRPLLDRRFYSLDGTLKSLGLKDSDLGEVNRLASHRGVLGESYDEFAESPEAKMTELFVVKGSQIVFKNSSDAAKAAGILQSAGLKSWKLRQDEQGTAWLHFAQNGAAENAAAHLAEAFQE